MKLRRAQVAQAPDASEELWSPVNREGTGQTTDSVRQVLAAQSLQLPASVLAAIEQVVHTPPCRAESHAAAALHKELALRAVFADLDAVTSSTLVRRLDRDDPGDPVVRNLRRLLPERRARLRAFLADCRRRTALRDPG